MTQRNALSDLIKVCAYFPIALLSNDVSAL